jgi:transcription elongation factor Elf1
MDDPSLRFASVLEFECPRCGHPEQDEFETLDDSHPADWRCDVCHRVFSVLLVACERCGNESVSVATNAAEQPRVREVICERCHMPCLRHEAKPAQVDQFD